MTEEFKAVTVTPLAGPVRDQRRIKAIRILWNDVIPEVVGVKAVAAVAAFPGVRAVAAVEGVEEVEASEGIDAVAPVDAVAAVEGEEPRRAVLAVEAVAPVAEVPEGSRIVSVEFIYMESSSTNERHPVKNPDGVVSVGGTNVYTGDDLARVLGQLLATTAAAEIEKCVAENSTDG